MPLREPMSPYYQDRLDRATDHDVIAQECTNKGRTFFKTFKNNKYESRYSR